MPIGKQDEHHIDTHGRRLRRQIEGVHLHERNHVVTRNGHTTELMRPEWSVVQQPVQHIIHVCLKAGALSAWHMHKLKTDHLFVVSGALRVVLYDAREGSPTMGQVDELIVSALRPTLLVIPPNLWHGVQNLHIHENCSFVNYFNQAYDYEQPDEWRLPEDSSEVPYRFPQR